MINSRGSSRFVLHRPVDIVIAAGATVVVAPLLVAAVTAAAVSTRSNGIFRQTRIGRHGKTFAIAKLRTMQRVSPDTSTVTARSDSRVTRFGRVARRLKIDELPQLLHVLSGEMALLGPRPDVPGFADLLQGSDRVILEIRPGISGPATLLFRNEETILDHHPNPVALSGEVLFPLKTKINLAWIHHGSLADDLRILGWTIFPPDATKLHAMLSRWDPSLLTGELAQHLAWLSAPEQDIDSSALPAPTPPMQ